MPHVASRMWISTEYGEIVCSPERILRLLNAINWPHYPAAQATLLCWNVRGAVARSRVLMHCAGNTNK